MGRYIQQPQFRGAFAPRRFILLATCFAVFIFIMIYAEFKRGAQPKSAIPHSVPKPGQGALKFDSPGAAIAPKLGNETARAELGNAAWKVIHTTFARFPEKPTKDESDALRQYIHLFQRLYPCGDCAEHFGQILKQFPPQVASRNAAAAWGCHVHNEVNKKLKKPLFDCRNIGDFYDCGCAKDEAEQKKEKEKEKEKEATKEKAKES